MACVRHKNVVFLYHTRLQAKISFLLFLTPSQMSESMLLYKIGVKKVNFSYSENVTCVCRKNLTAEQKQGCFYLYTSLWRSHRLAHSPALLTGAGLAHTWAWTWLYLTLSWTWSPFTIFRLSVKICHWHCTVHTPLLQSLPCDDKSSTPPAFTSTLSHSVPQ